MISFKVRVIRACRYAESAELHDEHFQSTSSHLHSLITECYHKVSANAVVCALLPFAVKPLSVAEAPRISGSVLTVVFLAPQTCSLCLACRHPPSTSLVQAFLVSSWPDVYCDEVSRLCYTSAILCNKQPLDMATA